MSGQSEEDLAAAWGAALEDEGAEPSGAAPAPDAARVLNQAEIDSLLGFDSKEGESGEESGIQRIISSGLVSYERLPMLEIVFDRMVRLMSTTLRNFTSDNVEVSIDGIVSLRFADYLNSIPLPAMLGVTRAEQWDNYGLVVVDSALIYSVVDVLLGGRRGTAAMRIEGRPYTTIERTLVERLIGVVLEDLTAAFEPLCPVVFGFERLEVNPRFAAISRPSNACVLVRLRVDMEDRGGKLELLLPYATLEPVRELLLQQFMGEKFGRDSIWETHLAEELRSTEVALDVVLDEQLVPLSSVIGLQVGDRIALGVAPGAPVRLRCGEVPLFEGELGRQEQRLAVRISRELERGRGGGAGMSILEWGLQLLLLLMLGAAIPFALRLERALREIRAGRSAMEGSAQGLNEATRMAEAAMVRLRASAELAGRQVAERLATAEPLRDDLRYLIERAEALADRLEGLVRAGRPMAQDAPRASEPASLQSQAERDLLRAITLGARTVR